MSNSVTLLTNEIESRIFTIRDLQVMLDRDLAELYGVETRIINQAVKRNIERFPSSFMFQLNYSEFADWKSQIVISNEDKMGLRRPPFAFTEQGVSMLSAVLHSSTAITVSVRIMETFVTMRKLISKNIGLIQRIESVEQKQIETDHKIDKIFDALENRELIPKCGIFFDGQIFDAYLLANKIIKSAKMSIILIDNYIDESVLTILGKKSDNVKVTLLTKDISKQLELDVEKFNEQYPFIEAKIFNLCHDRFLIIDGKDIYLLGASLKDLGKKWFAFSKMELDGFDLIEKIKGI
ncbi:MAG: ORF6N domain-containing protein [Chitinispirillales bacterium]|nr:ORF6N domain-containing protein [Chitinispirillales bacterium]